MPLAPALNQASTRWYGGAGAVLLAGAIHAAAAVTGTLSLVKLLAGQIAAAATVAGSLSVSGASAKVPAIFRSHTQVVPRIFK